MSKSLEDRSIGDQRAQKQPPRRWFSFTPSQSGVLVALIGALSAIAEAATTAYFTRGTEEKKSESALAIERIKVEGDLKLQEAKQIADAALARSEFETKLIFKVIEGSTSEEERTRNLLFFLRQDL